MYAIRSYYVSGLGLGGCTSSEPSENKSTGVVEIKGTLTTKMGDEYLLNTESGIINITSNIVNLDKEIGKEIKVKGMYSGSTLYVDEIE